MNRGARLPGAKPQEIAERWVEFKFDGRWEQETKKRVRQIGAAGNYFSGHTLLRLVCPETPLAKKPYQLRRCNQALRILLEAGRVVRVAHGSYRWA